MKIKVCGLKDPQNIKEVAALQPDYTGFIFYPGSPRFVGENFMMPSIAAHIKKVGVFVNARPDHVVDMIDQHGLDAIQLHGDESPAFCEAMSHFVTVFKAFGIDEYFDFGKLKSYQDSCHYFLFDTKTSTRGGSGEQFDHSLLEKYTGSVPFFLSGGIGAGDIERIAKAGFFHAQFAGLDLNSKFEKRPGQKDVNLLLDALSSLKALPLPGHPIT